MCSINDDRFVFSMNASSSSIAELTAQSLRFPCFSWANVAAKRSFWTKNLEKKASALATHALRNFTASEAHKTKRSHALELRTTQHETINLQGGTHG